MQYFLACKLILTNYNDVIFDWATQRFTESVNKIINGFASRERKQKASTSTKFEKSFEKNRKKIPVCVYLISPNFYDQTK